MVISSDGQTAQRRFRLISTINNSRWIVRVASLGAVSSSVIRLSTSVIRLSTPRAPLEAALRRSEAEIR
jgi:hypothetical protein